MPAPDGRCGIQTHDSWILRDGPYSLHHKCGQFAALNNQQSSNILDKLLTDIPYNKHIYKSSRAVCDI